MSRILAICFTVALLACHSSTQVNVPPTTTSATIPAAQQGPPSGPSPPPPSGPSPDPNSSQMPFEPRNFGH